MKKMCLGVGEMLNSYKTALHENVIVEMPFNSHLKYI